MARVVVIEPWYGGSHRAWLDGWQSHSRHELCTITLPDRFWRWRMRGSAVALADALADEVRRNGPADGVVVSGLVDVAALLGLARRALGETPAAVYMHENQVLYPLAPNQRPDPSLGLSNWRGLIAADAVWWNSAYHRDALGRGLDELLASQPEAPPDGWRDRVARHSTVLHPGVATVDLVAAERQPRPRPLVLWNQRWDHDKRPDAVFAALAAAAESGLEFDLALAGERHASGSELARVRQLLGDRVIHDGFADEATYRSLLLQTDLVVSAADHEFFGIALVEAMAAGAVPVLPDRLSFPELVESRWHATVLYPDGDLRRAVATALADIDAARRSVDGLRASMRRFDVAAAAEKHDRAVDQLVLGSGR